MATLPQEQFAEISDRGAKHQMRERFDECLKWTLMISLSPLAFLVVLLAALYGLLGFLYKVALLSTVVSITTPFLVMYNLSVLVWTRLPQCGKSSPTLHKISDPRASLGIEIKILVSDFLKQVAGQLLLAVSAGIITYFTSPLSAFYVTLIAGVAVVFHTWFNTDCLSRTALSYLCDGYGLSPLMFLFSYIGLFDIGCHPVAKCSFVAKTAFLFVEDERNQSSGKSSSEENVEQDDTILNLKDEPLVGQRGEPQWQDLETSDSSPKVVATYKILEPYDSPPHMLEPPCRGAPEWIQDEPSNQPSKVDKVEVNIGARDTKVITRSHWYPFEEAAIGSNEATSGSSKAIVEFNKWNAFERGLFHLNPRIDFITENHAGKYRYILKSFMVLKLFEQDLCKYAVERLELPEDYSKPKELFNFLMNVSQEDGFVTDKMRGRYEHSLTLLEITEGVQKNKGFRIVDPIDKRFVVAGCTNIQY